MCYLVAKDPEKHGCYALKTSHGKALVELKNLLNNEVGIKGVQLVTISRPTAYGEYAPYSFAKDSNEFVELVRTMRQCQHFPRLLHIPSKRLMAYFCAVEENEQLYEGAPDYEIWSESEAKKWILEEPEALYDFITTECQ